MANFVFNDVLKSPKGEFFLKTSISDSQKEIMSSLFRNGVLLETLTRQIEADWSNEKQRIKTREFHKEKKDEFKTLLELAEKLRNSDQAEMKNLLGLAFARRNVHEEAIIEFEDAIILNSDHPHLYNNLGLSYTAVGRYDEAIETFEKATSMAPDYADYHNNLGSTYLKKEYCKKAVEEFLKAIDSNPYYAEAYINLALGYILNAITKEDFALSVNCYQNVIDTIEKAIKINPDYKNEYVLEGESLLQKNEFEQAYISFEEALNQTSKPTELSFIMDFYLRVLHNDKNLSSNIIWRHIKHLQELIEKHPNYADLYNHLGVGYIIMSKYVNHKAVQQFNKAMNVNPDFERAMRNKRLAEYDHKGIQLLFDAILK